MDLVIELKISNPTDWAMLQPLLQRLKIPFVQKAPAALPEIAIPARVPVFAPLSKGGAPSILDVWSPFDAYDAADALLQAMKNNPNKGQTNFFMEFDVLFARSARFFEISPKDTH